MRPLSPTQPTWFAFRTLLLGLAFGIALLAPRATFAADAAPGGPPLHPEVPFLAEWISSPHADWKSESFTHWNKDGAIPEACARCHSGTGFIDFMGADGSTPGKVDHPAALGSVITCVACHNDTTLDLASVTFPSGLKVAKQGKSARCMQCHQGRQAGADVAKAIKGIGDDAVSDKLKFLNVHYRAAGATLMGTLAKGAFEYDGMRYAASLKHKDSVNECVECHDPHRTEVKVATCTACHKEVIARKDLVNIRDGENNTDFDGDGNVFEGVAGEVSTLHTALYDMMRDYAKSKIGKPMAYDAHAYPYFFHDTNGNGIIDEKEGIYPNQYKAWTPRLLRAAYNYQFVAKDPGAYSHNTAYTLQILHDSIVDMAKAVPNAAPGMVRPK